MSQLDLARLQFAMTSIYHFLFVPVTIGLAFLTALLQTAWYRTGDEDYLRLTRFFGTLLVINVAVGVVTGLVQEFQFGMDWSAYSRSVGNVFGAPLAMEGLAAFFLESTFLGLWLFGWDKLSRRVHLADDLGGRARRRRCRRRSSWRPTRGCSTRSATRSTSTGRPQLNDIWAVLTNPVFLLGLRARAARVAGHRRRRSCWPSRPGSCAAARAPEVFARRPGSRWSCWSRRSLFGMLVGSELGVIEAQVPADEDRRGRGAVDDLPAVLVLAVPDRRRQQRPDPDEDHRRSRTCCRCWPPTLERPGGRAERAAGAVQQQYGPGQLRAERVHPVLVDAGDGLPAAAAGPASRCGGCGCSAAGGSRRPGGSCGSRSGRRSLPFVMNTAGWLLTENGRQPWIVQGLQLTKDGVSPSVGTDRGRDQPHRVLRCCTACSAVVDLRADAAVRPHASSPRAGRAEADAAGRRPGRAPTEGDHDPRRPSGSSSSPCLWTGFFVLEGFDFGVGMLHGVVGRDEAGRRAAINTIGPLWDGNEVWLIVAGGRHVRRVPRLVRDDVLRPLPRARRCCWWR